MRFSPHEGRLNSRRGPTQRFLECPQNNGLEVSLLQTGKRLSVGTGTTPYLLGNRRKVVHTLGKCSRDCKGGVGAHIDCGDLPSPGPDDLAARLGITCLSD